ncbi:hypothetical protein, partial [Aeromonas salmonicida]|uniref:hypothetical protein n=1 Tax=Aeromonas salmonicida TaxID=645 RepID=UPI0037ED43D5
LVTSPDIENQQNCLMFDAVSAHTDCLIQIVKERHACRVEEAHITLLTSKVKRLFSLFFRRWLHKEAGSSGWRVPPYWYGAHYREPRRDDKGFFITIARSLRYAANPCLFAHNPINSGFDWI